MHDREWNSGDVRMWLDAKDVHHLKTKTKKHHLVLTVRHNGRLRKRDVIRASARIRGLEVIHKDNSIEFYTTAVISNRRDALSLVDSFVSELETIRRNRAKSGSGTPPTYRNRSHLGIVR